MRHSQITTVVRDSQIATVSIKLEQIKTAKKEHFSCTPCYSHTHTHTLSFTRAHRYTHSSPSLSPLSQTKPKKRTRTHPHIHTLTLPPLKTQCLVHITKKEEEKGSPSHQFSYLWFCWSPGASLGWRNPPGRGRSVPAGSADAWWGTADHRGQTVGTMHPVSVTSTTIWPTQLQSQTPERWFTTAFLQPLIMP